MRKDRDGWKLLGRAGEKLHAFVRQTEDRVELLPRYLKTMQLRTDKNGSNHERDAKANMANGIQDP